MKTETFHKRLRSGKGVTYTYNVGQKNGGINIWKSQDIFVLTWEEAHLGDEFDESLYTKDEVHHFNNIDSIINFLMENSINIEDFEP